MTDFERGAETMRACLVCPEKAVRGTDPVSGALWCWRHGPFYESDLFFRHASVQPPGSESREADARAVVGVLLDRSGFDAWWDEIDLEDRQDILAAIGRALAPDARPEEKK